jgi:hypothetical protein
MVNFIYIIIHCNRLHTDAPICLTSTVLPVTKAYIANATYMYEYKLIIRKRGKGSDIREPT